MQQVTILASRGKLIMAIAISLLFVALGIAIILLYAQTYIRSSYALLVGIVASGTFGYMAGIGIKKLARPPEQLVINQQGIILPKTGLIAWQDIAGFSQLTLSGCKLISIEVSDVDKYLNQLSHLDRFKAVKSQQLCGAAFTISPGALSGRRRDLEILLQHKLSEYRATL